MKKSVVFSVLLFLTPAFMGTVSATGRVYSFLPVAPAKWPGGTPCAQSSSCASDLVIFHAGFRFI